MAAARRSLLEVGEIVRPHGLQGGVVVRLVTDQVDRVEVGATFDIEGRVLTIRATRPLKRRFVVSFHGVDTVEDAEALRGVVLHAEPLDLVGVLWVDEVIGASVVTTEGSALGIVQAVEANPASDLLVLDSGALIPVRFVVGDLVDGIVIVDVPEGLV